jgi:hypothetical protein
MSSATPRDYQRRNSSETRRENERHANENYHPSEAAHHPHPHALPPQMPPMHSLFEAAKEERKEHVEPAARKVEVDEDYDNNNSDDDKRALGSGGARSSPQNTMMNGPMKQETVV